MSDKTAPAVHSVPETEETASETKQSFAQKTKTFVKSHKKPTIAVVALVGLVGVSALTGRKTATVTVQSPLEIEVEDSEPAEDQSA